MRVALFGGTFDPVHRGHVAIARAAADAFALDTVFLAPAGRQPLKEEPPTASYAQRLMMTALACGEDTRFAVSNLDAPRSDGAANYTVRTLGLLRELMPKVELYCIAGADSFRTLGQWREPERLLELAEWIVVSRPGFALAEPEGMALTGVQRARIHTLDGVAETVSATDLRQRLEERSGCAGLLPVAVEQYIRAEGLYAGVR